MEEATYWFGEVLYVDLCCFERQGHISYIKTFPKTQKKPLERLSSEVILFFQFVNSSVEVKTSPQTNGKMTRACCRVSPKSSAWMCMVLTSSLTKYCQNNSITTSNNGLNKKTDLGLNSKDGLNNTCRFQYQFQYHKYQRTL